MNPATFISSQLSRLYTCHVSYLAVLALDMAKLAALLGLTLAGLLYGHPAHYSSVLGIRQDLSQTSLPTVTGVSIDISSSG